MVINSHQSHIHTFRIQTFHICCLLCVVFYQVLLTLIERFIMLPRLRSRTHHIYVLLLHWKYAKTCLPFISTQKYFAPTLRVNTKKCLLGFYQINALSSCHYLSWKVLLPKRDKGLCKIKGKKREKERKKRVKNG